MTEEKLRTFLAFEIPPKVKEHLLDLRERFLTNYRRQLPREKGDSFIMTKDRHLHVTLLFLGDTTLKDVEVLQAQFAAIIKKRPVLPVELTETGIFPHAGNPRVLWVGLTDPDGVLRRMAWALSKRAREHGFEVSRRKFTPHITMGRVKQLAPGTPLAHLWLTSEVIPMNFEIKEIVWFQSFLEPTGARHEPLVRFPLTPKVGESNGSE